MSDNVWVQGDTLPPFEAIIHDSINTDDPENLTGATVKFQMRKPDDRRYTVNAAATIVNAIAGHVKYEWGPNDLAVAGVYQVQFEITFEDGGVETTQTPIEITVRRQ